MQTENLTAPPVKQNTSLRGRADGEGPIPRIDFQTLIHMQKGYYKTEREPTEQEKTEVKYYNWAAGILEIAPQSWQYLARVHDNDERIINGGWLESQLVDLTEQTSMTERARLIVDILNMHLVVDKDQQESSITSRLNKWTNGLLDGYIETFEGDEGLKRKMMGQTSWDKVGWLYDELDKYEKGGTAEVIPPSETDNLARTILTMGQYIRFLRHNNDLIFFGPASVEDVLMSSQNPFDDESEEILDYLISNSRIDNVAVQVQHLPDDPDERLFELQSRSEFIREIRAPKRVKRVQHSSTEATSRWIYEKTVNARTIMTALIDDGLTPIIIENKQRCAAKYNNLEKRRVRFSEVAQLFGYKNLMKEIISGRANGQPDMFAKDIEIETALLVLYPDTYKVGFPNSLSDAFERVQSQYEWELWLASIGFETDLTRSELRARYEFLERVGYNGSLTPEEREEMYMLFNQLFVDENGDVDLDTLFGPSKINVGHRERVDNLYQEFIFLIEKKNSTSGLTQDEVDKLDELSRRLYGQNYRVGLELKQLNLNGISAVDPFGLIRSQQRSQDTHQRQLHQQSFFDQVEEVRAKSHYDWE